MQPTATPRNGTVDTLWICLLGNCFTCGVPGAAPPRRQLGRGRRITVSKDKAMTHISHPKALCAVHPRLQQSWACPKLTCPITAFCGTHDPFVTDKDMQGWNGSSAHFCLRTIEGGHAFVHARGKDICQEILAQHVR